MFMRILPTALFALSLALFGAAGYAYFLMEEDAPGAVIPDPDREFPSLAVGKNEVRFRLENPTGHTVRVIGCQYC
jgi:hypothetical protein